MKKLSSKNGEKTPKKALAKLFLLLCAHFLVGVKITFTFLDIAFLENPGWGFYKGLEDPGWLWKCLVGNFLLVCVNWWSSVVLIGQSESFLVTFIGLIGVAISLIPIPGVMLSRIIRASNLNKCIAEQDLLQCKFNKLLFLVNVISTFRVSIIGNV